MASSARRRAENVAGELFVDDSCIDCDACRWIAPATFDRAGEQSRVHAQPRTAETRADALAALVACPTRSIGVDPRAAASGGELRHRFVAETVDSSLAEPISAESNVAARSESISAESKRDTSVDAISTDSNRTAHDEAIAAPSSHSRHRGSISADSVGRERSGDPASDVLAAARCFPRHYAGNAYHCGFHDEATFGAASWLLARSKERGGNVLVDVPRWNSGLADRIEALGGASLVLLTHSDDVGEHARWAERLGAKRVIHEHDVDARTRDVEIVLTGATTHDLGGGLLAIPTPGHTAGSTCFLLDETLATGDHLAFSRSRGHVYAFASACWFDWKTQIESVEKLREHRIARLVPGHGAPCAFDADEMRSQLERCVAWMRTAR